MYMCTYTENIIFTVIATCNFYTIIVLTKFLLYIKTEEYVTYILRQYRPFSY